MAGPAPAPPVPPPPGWNRAALGHARWRTNSAASVGQQRGREANCQLAGVGRIASDAEVRRILVAIVAPRPGTVIPAHGPIQAGRAPSCRSRGCRSVMLKYYVTADELIMHGAYSGIGARASKGMKPATEQRQLCRDHAAHGRLGLRRLHRERRALRCRYARIESRARHDQLVARSARLERGQARLAVPSPRCRRR